MESLATHDSREVHILAFSESASALSFFVECLDLVKMINNHVPSKNQEEFLTR